MANHRVSIVREFEMNGHDGAITWNDTTQYHTLVCYTCKGQAGGGLVLDQWRRNTRRYPQYELTWQQHVDPLNHPVAGQRYRWNGVEYVVTRVSEGARWADIRVIGDNGWSKRQPLPLPAGSVPVQGGDRRG